MTYISLVDAFNELGKLLFPEEWCCNELDAFETYKLIYKNNEIVELRLKGFSSLQGWVFNDSIEVYYPLNPVAISDVMLNTYYTSNNANTVLIAKYKELQNRFIDDSKKVELINKDKSEFKKICDNLIEKYKPIQKLFSKLVSHEQLLNKDSKKYNSNKHIECFEELIKFSNYQQDKEVIQWCRDSLIKNLEELGLGKERYFNAQIRLEVACKCLDTILSGVIKIMQCCKAIYFLDEDMRKFGELIEGRNASIFVNAEKLLESSEYDNSFLNSLDKQIMCLKDDAYKEKWREKLQVVVSTILRYHCTATYFLVKKDLKYCKLLDNAMEEISFNDIKGITEHSSPFSTKDVFILNSELEDIKPKDIVENTELSSFKRPWLEFIEYVKNHEKSQYFFEKTSVKKAPFVSEIEQYYAEYKFYEKYNGQFIRSKTRTPKTLQSKSKEKGHELSEAIATFLTPGNDENYPIKNIKKYTPPFLEFIKYTSVELDKKEYIYRKELKYIMKKVQDHYMDFEFYKKYKDKFTTKYIDEELSNKRAEAIAKFIIPENI